MQRANTPPFHDVFVEVPAALTRTRHFAPFTVVVTPTSAYTGASMRGERSVKKPRSISSTSAGDRSPSGERGLRLFEADR